MRAIGGKSALIFKSSFVVSLARENATISNTFGSGELLLRRAQSRPRLSHVNNEVGNASGNGASANEDDLLLPEWSDTLDARCAGNSGGGDSSCALDVVETVAPLAEVVEEAEVGFHLEILPLDEAC